MKFDIEAVRNLLLRTGEVFTVRTWESRSRYSVTSFEGKSYMIEKVKNISDPKDLQGFIRKSGFNKAVDWWTAIKQFGATNGFLYHVTLIEDEVPDKSHIPYFTAVLETELRECDRFAMMYGMEV